jgi:diadenosine tetraphosphate (Ap4A) HIT family hydrolase
MTKNNTQPACVLCETNGGLVIWSGQTCRVIDANDPNHPGLTRVVWSAHIAEMTDLTTDQQQLIMQIVLTVEQVMRQHLNPLKINLASLGNFVPHLHWHVIPRWNDDASFPDSIWSVNKRTTEQTAFRRSATDALLPTYHDSLRAKLIRDFGDG